MAIYVVGAEALGRVYCEEAWVGCPRIGWLRKNGSNVRRIVN